MTFQPGANLYAVAFGSRPENVEVPHYDVRAPNSTDILYPIGKSWIDTRGLNAYILVGLSSSNGVTTATWVNDAVSGGPLNTLSDDSSATINPVSNNIQIAGTSGQIITTAGVGVLTISVDDPFVAPGSIESTTSLTVGTDLSVGGNVTITGSVTLGGLDVNSSGQISLVSSQNAADAIVVNASAGGIDILASGAAAGEDIDIVATGSSVNITSTENVADSIVITSSAGGIDILASGAAAGEDIDIVATGSSINIRSTESAVDSVVIESTLGGIQILASGAAATEDIVVTSTGSSIRLTATENVTDAINIEATTGGVNILASGASAGEDINVTATGSSINLTSTENAALGIYLHANGGTSETIRIHSDQGTGVASIDLLSDVGGVTITAGVASADAVNIVASNAAGGIDIDSGTAGFIVDTTGAISLDSAAASNFTVTGAGLDLTLSSAGGSVLVESTEDAALAIRLHANGGTSETIQIHSDQGTGVESIGLLSDVGGITVRSSGLASADAINFEAAAGGIDMDSALLTSITSTFDNAQAILVQATLGGIDILASGAAAGEDIDIIATGSSVNISATESVADSITIVSTAGGIDILASGAAAGEDIDIVATGSSVNISATENVTDAIVINASGAASALQLDAGTGSIRFGSGLVVPSTAVNNAASPYTVLGTDYLLAVDTSAGAVTVTLPAATALAGRTYVIRDVGGAAAVNNITIGGGGTNLVGGGAAAATKTLSAAYSGATVISDGTIWTYAYVA